MMRDHRQKAEQAGHQCGSGGELTIEIIGMAEADYQHVPRSVARVSGNGVGGGSIGGAERRAIPRRQSFCDARDSLTGTCQHVPQEAEITAALGRRSIVLVGMMGAGKSTIGRRLAARLRLPFLDADTEIEAAAGMSIPDIFETHGEPHFRDGEARVIARLLDSGPA